MKVLKDKDAWWFMFFYMITFGGFSGFAGALPGYFADQFGFDLKTAGMYTAACVFSGSVMRPLGGVLADRIGGVKSLLMVYTAASVLIALAGFNVGGAVGTTAICLTQSPSQNKALWTYPHLHMRAGLDAAGCWMLHRPM